MCVYSELDALSNPLASFSVEGCELAPSPKELLDPVLYMIFNAFGARLRESSRRGYKDSRDARLKSERKEMRNMSNGHDRKMRLRLSMKI